MGQGSGTKFNRTAKIRSGSGKIIARGRTDAAMGRQKINRGSVLANAQAARANYRAADRRKARRAARPSPTAR